MIHKYEQIPSLSTSFKCCKLLPDRKILIYCHKCLNFKIFSLNEELLTNNLHLMIYYVKNVISHIV